MTITCATCQNTDFYEDAEGQLSCTLCGIQSQDFLAISNDLDENINDTRNEKRKWQRQKATSSRERNVSKQENISSKVYIEVFQYCLKLFVSSMPHDSNRLLGQVKLLWVEYLMKWMDSDDNKEIITHTSSSSNAYTTESRPDRKKGTTNSSRYDDVYKCTPPYKPLLIAFTYLAIRQLRLPILPSDLVRWCVQGQLPYSSLFEKLPADIQASLPSVFRKRLVEHFNPSVSTTSNIMYNTSALASFLGIPMLPLNAPLIVRSMISALGLPLTVWRQYARLGQLRRHDTELQIFDSNNEMYIENLMAQLIICVMLCPDWETWILMRPSTSEVNGSDDDDKDDGNIKVATRNPTIVPSTLPALNMTTRSDLPQLLATIRSTLYSFRRFLPNVSEGILTFNQPVQTVLRDVSPSVLLDLVGGKALALDCSDLKFWSGSSNFDKSVVVPPAVLYPSVSMLSRETIREIKFSSMSSLPCYSNHTNDPGVLLPAYTALLERCAVYIYSTPIILFRLVLSYEIPMAELSQLLTNYAAVMAVKQEKSLAKSIEQDQTVIKEEDDSSL